VSESRRVQRVEKELQHLVANYLLRGFKGQLRGLVSVSRVESNPKLRTAKVYVSILGSDDDRDFSLESLEENIRDIQQHVNKQLRMKFVPRLSIVLDTGLQKLLRVETLLREISQESKRTKNSEEE
jgi:ribosome-binding factor A